MQRIFTLRNSPGKSVSPLFYDIEREELRGGHAQVSNASTLDLVDYGRLRLPDDFAPEERELPYNEINCLLSGSGEIIAGGVRHRMVPGRLYLFPSGRKLASCRNRRVLKGYCHFRLLHQGIELLDGMNPVSAPCAAIDSRRWVEALSGRNVFEVKAAVLEMLSRFDAPLGEVTSRRSAVYEKYGAFFAAAAKGEDLAAIAARFGRSKKAFAAAFKESFGITPKRYLHRLLTSRIQSRLLQSERTLADLSEEFAFSDPFYFSRFFKKQVGLSPSEYREAAKRQI